MSVTYKGEEFIVRGNRLSLKRKGISDITEIEGLDNLTNLEKLTLKSNNISEIKGLENLTNLKWLFLQNNPINEIKGLENLTNLKNLYLPITRKGTTYYFNGIEIPKELRKKLRIRERRYSFGIIDVKAQRVVDIAVTKKIIYNRVNMLNFSIFDSK